ncbi:hypothetical protein [Pseudomonas quasicaspiana]|uniref:hypothetical protein n=1 Tax=Pseudomonas quasicaspiana TaxID=2829821 RepID=UPI001E3D9756|nr:hypothetical protein [Pseudomonas quasicaspiana]MCD5973084.1 hypothetical protein [Pseudomonas quasicaspiana]
MSKVEDSLLSDRTIEYLEALIPKQAAAATHTAYVRALAAGNTVLKIEGSYVIASSANGVQEVIGPVKPRRKVIFGEVIKVRRLDLDL